MNKLLSFTGDEAINTLDVKTRAGATRPRAEVSHENFSSTQTKPLAFPTTFTRISSSKIDDNQLITPPTDLTTFTHGKVKVTEEG